MLVSFNPDVEKIDQELRAKRALLDIVPRRRWAWFPRPITGIAFCCARRARAGVIAPSRATFARTGAAARSARSPALTAGRCISRSPRPAKPIRANRTLAIASAVFSYAIELDIIADNPTRCQAESGEPQRRRRTGTPPRLLAGSVRTG
jgi:hypothetical protein